MTRFFPKLRSSRFPIKLKTGYIDEQPHASDSESFSNTSTRIISLLLISKNREYQTTKKRQ